MTRHPGSWCCTLALLLGASVCADPSGTRNMANLSARNIPIQWGAGPNTKNVHWVADLGKMTGGSPVLAGELGLVLVPMTFDTRKGAIVAFRAADGAKAWQNEHAYAVEHRFRPDAPGGLPSTPTMDGRHLYYVTPAAEIFCAQGVDGAVVWSLDMSKTLGVYSYGETFGTPVPASPLVMDERVFITTGNGPDLETDQFPAPQAPSFVALNKRTGKVLWTSNLPGKRVFDGQWSSPAYAEINGRRQVIFAGGDAVIYSFDPESGELLWKCDCLPERHGDKDPPRNYFVGAPVIVGSRLYIGQGVHAEHAAPPRSSRFLCLDITKKGDVSLKSYDAKDAANKDTALVWAFGDPIIPPPTGKDERRVYFGPTMSTAAVHDGLVYITEMYGYLHCLDAATGRRLWVHDLQGAAWGSPLWVDNKIYVANEDGIVNVFAHGRTRKRLAEVEMDEIMQTTPAAHGNTLYLATRRRLFAIAAR